MSATPNRDAFLKLAHNANADKYIENHNLTEAEMGELVEAARAPGAALTWAFHLVQNNHDPRNTELRNPEWHKLLVQYVWSLDDQLVKALPRHLYVYFLQNYRNDPDRNSSQDHVFEVLRYATTKKDLLFARRFGTRSDLHSNRGKAALLKLEQLADDLRQAASAKAKLEINKTACFSW